MLLCKFWQKKKQLIVLLCIEFSNSTLVKTLVPQKSWFFALSGPSVSIGACTVTTTSVTKKIAAPFCYQPNRLTQVNQRAFIWHFHSGQNVFKKKLTFWKMNRIFECTKMTAWWWWLLLLWIYKPRQIHSKGKEGESLLGRSVSPVRSRWLDSFKNFSSASFSSTN